MKPFLLTLRGGRELTIEAENSLQAIAQAPVAVLVCVDLEAMKEQGQDNFHSVNLNKKDRP
jgi:hypothetical protein